VTQTLSDGEHHSCRSHPRGSVRRASGFVLTGKPYIGHSPEIASAITRRNGSRSKSYWTKTRQGIKLVNALSEESVGQSNHGLEANPTTDSSLKPARGECSPASRSPRAGFPDLLLSRHQRCPRWENPSAKTVEASDGRRCYNSQPGEHRRSDISKGDGAHGKEEVSEPPP
jgi:hypothetical protein